MSKLETTLLVFASVAALAGASFAFSATHQVNTEAAKTAATAKPVKIKLVKITAPDCRDCVDVNKIIQAFKSLPIELQDEREVSAASEEGKGLIAKLGIEKLPAFIAQGDVTNDKLAPFTLANGKLLGDVFLLTNVPPVYLEPATGKIKGRLAATVLYDKRQCAECTDPTPLLGQFQNAGITVADVKTVDPKSAEGKTLTDKYKITAVPTLVVTGETELYPILKSAPFGTVEADGAFVVRNVPPPYVDVKSGQTHGLASLILLADKSCKECYDVTKHKTILAQTFGIKLVSEKTVDAASAQGRALVRRYSITRVPTALISPAAADYPDLKAVWPRVGTVEKDGWYVFREITALGQGTAYKDLATNSIVKAATASSATSTAAGDMSSHHQ